MSQKSEHISNFLEESRQFPPPADFQKKAKLQSKEQYESLYKESITDNEAFWAKKARERLHWDEDFTKTLEWTLPNAKWFVGGKLNASYNCLDRHVANGKGNKTALIWEGEPGSHDVKRYTYSELLAEVSKAANGMKQLGLLAGDRVTIYMPMVPELAIAVLACARLGLVHSVVFGGFSAEALSGRIDDAQSKLVITADYGHRRGKPVALKSEVDKALESVTCVHHVLVVSRDLQNPCAQMRDGRDYHWNDHVSGQSDRCAHEALDSEHPLFILHTSGSTGKPKGILHTTGGYLLGANFSFSQIFDHKDDDIFWCTADVGWITGHSYLIYGPLSEGATIFMYEGAPNFPNESRFWDMIQRHKVSIFYTAPTAIRAFIKWGERHITGYDLSSLRLLGTVGEPINPEAWIWYKDIIGGGRCPIVDTWWQTETGSIMIAPLPGASTAIPGSATKPFFGIDADVVDGEGNSVPANTGGYLVIKKPWPSMLRTIYGDAERFEKQYWSQIPGMYFTGDGARKDENGNFWIMGRIDDVLNVSGHRLSTMEIESALVSHPMVAEAAVVGKSDELKGEAISCFVVLEQDYKADDTLEKKLMDQVVSQIGPIARPDEIRFTDVLPKTRSGKIMRRLLRDIAEGRESAGDTSTLEDFGVLDSLRKSV